MQTAYSLLGIRPDADDEAIKTAFREAAKLHHPDRRPGDPHAAFRFRQIATASEILRDPERRADYDRWLALERQRMRSEFTLAFISRTIDVAVFAVVLIIGLVWMVPLSTPEREPRPDSEIARATVDPVPAASAARPDAPPGEATQEEITAAVSAPSDAGPATDNVATAAAVAPSGPAPSPRTDEPEQHREQLADAGPTETIPAEVAGAAAAGQPSSTDAKAEARPRKARGANADPDRALAIYDEAIRIIPNNPILFHDRGLMWRRKGDLDRALADLDRAIRFDFSRANFYNDRGLIWLEKGRYNRAIADFDRASQIDPTLVDASINRDIAVRRETEVAHDPADGDRQPR